MKLSTSYIRCDFYDGCCFIGGGCNGHFLENFVAGVFVVFIIACGKGSYACRAA